MAMPRPDPTNVILHHQMREAQMRLVSARTMVERAQDMAQAARAADVSIPPLVRFMYRSLPEYRHLRGVLEQQLQRMLEAQAQRLKTLARQGDEQRVRHLLAQLKRQEWPVLQGGFPRLLHQARRHEAAVLAQLARDREQERAEGSEFE